MFANVHTEQLYGKETTIDRIKEICGKFWSDLGNAARLSPVEFFDRVRNIPYRRDPKKPDSTGRASGVEVIARPGLLIRHHDLGLDCKKKTILMICYAIARGIPWRIVTSSRRPDKNHHHVFPQWKIAGKWINADATYAHNQLGERKEVTDFKVYI